MRLVTFEELLEPVGVEQFLTDFLGKRVIHLQGDPDRFDQLFDWAALREMIDDHRNYFPRLRLVRDGNTVPVESYTTGVATTIEGSYETLDVDGFLAELTRGATLVLDSVDESHPALRELALGVEHVVREQAKINLYASWSDRAGFRTHWDDHDVFVLQLTGAKRWQLYENPRSWPLRRDTVSNAEPPDQPTSEIVVKAGDFMHVPRGVWHRVTPVATPAMHLTVGIARPTGIDLLGWLADQMIDVDVFRQDLPRFAGPVARAEHLERLLTQLSSRAGRSNLLDDFFDHQDSLAPVRPRVRLPSLDGQGPLDARTVIAWTAPRAVLEESPDGRYLTVSAQGRRLRFASPAGAVIRLIQAARATTLGTLTGLAADVANAAEVESVIADLCVQGLVVTQAGD